MELTRSLQVLHLSDMHFGKSHICNAPSEGASRKGFPELHELLLRDLTSIEVSSSSSFRHSKSEPVSALILALSGDFTQEATNEEFQSALEFAKGLFGSTILGTKIEQKNTFIVPGNHDVRWNEKAAKARFGPYVTFYNELFEGIDNRPTIKAHQPEQLNCVHVNEESGFIFVELNSCLYVEKDTFDASRGQIDLEAIGHVRRKLSEIKKDILESCVKIAMIHHHPVLLPTLVESKNNYDAVINANSLLQLLNSFGFHLLLHGHKHHPQVFTYDPQLAWAPTDVLPQIVVAAGSCGSRELPESNSATNCYNLIEIKWHPAAKQGRIQVITRGLVRKGSTGVLDPDQWSWKTEKIVDRTLNTSRTTPPMTNGFGHLMNPDQCVMLPPPDEKDASEQMRINIYAVQRGYLATCDVLPSLVPGQAYEVRAWIVGHREPQAKLKKVVWSCGKMFPRKQCSDDPAKTFGVTFQYWGPMLIQAELHFDDHEVRYAHVYARLPREYT